MANKISTVEIEPLDHVWKLWMFWECLVLTHGNVPHQITIYTQIYRKVYIGVTDKCTHFPEISCHANLFLRKVKATIPALPHLSVGEKAC